MPRPYWVPQRPRLLQALKDGPQRRRSRRDSRLSRSHLHSAQTWQFVGVGVGVGVGTLAVQVRVVGCQRSIGRGEQQQNHRPSRLADGKQLNAKFNAKLTVILASKPNNTGASSYQFISHCEACQSLQTSTNVYKRHFLWLVTPNARQTHSHPPAQWPTQCCQA